MDSLLRVIMGGMGAGRLVLYLNCSQATLNTLRRYLRVPDKEPLLFACPLEGGGAGSGSTCGIVSGGCLAITLGHLGDLLEPGEGKADSLYARMREYAQWFGDRFGSTLCRRRTGLDLGRPVELARYLLEGRFLSRCARSAAPAIRRLVGMVEEPLPGTGRPGILEDRLFKEGGLCGSGILAEARRRFGLGSVTLERISVALDGGVGLSG
ncbi:MAG: C-GCAxxG-C-C family protein, partial [Candidatus Geothermincolales bacterium]